MSVVVLRIKHRIEWNARSKRIKHGDESAKGNELWELSTEGDIRWIEVGALSTDGTEIL